MFDSCCVLLTCVVFVPDRSNDLALLIATIIQTKANYALIAFSSTTDDCSYAFSAFVASNIQDVERISLAGQRFHI